MTSPYAALEDRAFWKTGVEEQAQFPPNDLYRPKFPITETTRIFTAGSCFAQHVGRHLKAKGFAVIDGEPAPEQVSDGLAQRFGYGMYSGRYGNVYTVRQMLQLVLEAQGRFVPANVVWERDGAFFDAMRPNVEPYGLEQAELVHEARAYHLGQLLKSLQETELFVFTLGLTESWADRASGTVYPTAPGTIAGSYDESAYSFRNFRYAEIREDFEDLRAILQLVAPGMRFLLTVSPVPLTATATGGHVLSATVYSKSVLRAVAGDLAADYEDVDYFPSFEIISSHVAPKAYYGDNLRQVSDAGVNAAMERFFQAHDIVDPRKRIEDVRQMREARRARRRRMEQAGEDAVVCEEELLNTFAK